MLDISTFPEGGYRYIKAAFQFAAGVAAEPGFAIERARFTRPLPLADGFAAAETHLKSLGRPATALCACELRMHKHLAAEAFHDFNIGYVKPLERWGLARAGENSVARTAVVPAHDAPSSPSLYAFSYTVPASRGTRISFITAAAGELRRGADVKPEDRIVAKGDASPAGLQQKIRHVLGEMDRRLGLLGVQWANALETQAYTARDIGPFVEFELVRRGATPGGLTWHFSRPVLAEVEYEMDVRSPHLTLTLPV